MSGTIERLTMSVGEMAIALGISRPKAYDLTESADFPCIRVGRRKVIPVEGFKLWLEKQTAAVKGASGKDW